MGRTAQNQVNFRVTDDELAILKLQADRAGLKIPAFCKNAALSVKVRPQVIDKESAMALLPYVSRIGSSLEQMERIAIAGESLHLEKLTEVKAEFQKLWDYVLQGKKPHISELEKLENAGQTVLVTK